MPRRVLDGVKLAADIAHLTTADKLSPPAARPSLMDAVREFAGFIETRAVLGWTDPMIAAVLTEAGYPIDPATLRSYRKRLRDEGLLEAGPKRAGRAAVGAASIQHANPTGGQDREEQGQDRHQDAVPAAASAVEGGISSPGPSPAHVLPAARGPPDASPSARPPFKITQALPLDEA